jgi:hypothetical protein
MKQLNFLPLTNFKVVTQISVNSGNNCYFFKILLLTLQSFVWLAAFHLELLQAILFVAV